MGDTPLFPRALARTKVYTDLRAAILDGRLRPGERLVEAQIAPRYGVSRTPTREALLLLAHEGIVVIAGGAMIVRSLSLDEMSEIYIARIAIEPYAARVAAEACLDRDLVALNDLHITFSDLISQLTTALREHSGSDDPSNTDLDQVRSKIARLNRIFHVRVVEATRNAFLASLVRQIVETPLVSTATVWYDADALIKSMEDHAELLDSLRVGDPEAAEACWREHLGRGMKILLRQLEESRWR